MAFARVGYRPVAKPRKVRSGAGPRPRTAPPTGAIPPTFNGNYDNLYEKLGDDGNDVSGMGAGLEGTKTTRTWRCNPADFNDLTSAFGIILGSCSYDNGGQPRLNRTLPLADPVAPWAYAATVPTVRGFGKYALTAADPTLESPPFPYSMLFDIYDIEVESLTRPFPVLPDNLIQVLSGSWYSESGSGTSKEVYQYAREQDRFCTASFAPQGEYVVMQTNSMVGNSAGVSPNPNNALLPTGPRVYLPNALYTVKWFFVPYRLVLSSNSYLERWRGRINQNSFTGPDGFNFPAGSLLYINYAVEPYTPPVNALTSLDNESTSVSTDKFVTITMTLLYTKRTLTGSTASAPTNKNYIVGGHNLLPWTDTNFYYFQVPTGTKQPIFLSAPLETLWSDCDASNAVP